MTKKIRIENADTSEYNVIVEVFEKSNTEGPDILVETKELSYPTAMCEVTLWSSRRISIRETDKKEFK